MKVRPSSLLNAYLGDDVKTVSLPVGTSPRIAKGLALMNQATDTDDAEKALVGHPSYEQARLYIETLGEAERKAAAAEAKKKKAAAAAKKAAAQRDD